MFMGISSTQEEFPNGEPDSNEQRILIVCLNNDHRKNVAKAFKLRAMHVLPGRSIPVWFDQIIIFTPPATSGKDMLRFKNYIDRDVLVKLKNPNTSPQERIHYV